MIKLKRDEFNERYRFRESRIGKFTGSLINCVSCSNMTGETNDKEGPSFCEHPERFRKIKIAEYWRGFFGPGESHNLASQRVCDAYMSNQLPEGIEKVVIPEKHAILLGSQWEDIYHADPNCPYVIEELRMQKEGKKINHREAKVKYISISEKVPGESINDICDMPCCESKLPFQILRSDYRRHVGIKPDGTEPIKWVRNGIVKHQEKVSMTPEEAETVFDLSKFNSKEFGDVWQRISAVASYLHEHCNVLGSRPLSEAVNPIALSRCFNLLDHHVNRGFWVYNERLFNWRDQGEILKKPIMDLEKIPEGIIPCVDTWGVFGNAISCCPKYLGNFSILGLVKPLEDEFLLSKGATHFIEIGAVSYSGHEHLWGEFGRGFSKLESFDRE